MKLFSIKTPNTFLIIFSLLIIITALTWIIPAGEYSREEVDGRRVVVNGSFKFTERSPQSFDAILLAPVRGFVNAAEIIGLVFLVGGAFGVFQKTKAVDSLIIWVAKLHKNSRFVRLSIIPLTMIIFSLAGSIFGMSEEVIPFILIFVPLSLMLGYDTIVGLAMPFIGSSVGFTCAFFNPFTVGIAQGIAQIPLFSGIEYRIVVWAITTAAAIIFVSFYAGKVKKNPALSITFKSDEEKRKSLDFNKIDEHAGLSPRHKLVLIIFLSGIGVLIIGVLKYGWFIPELAAVFLATGIAVGITGKLSVNEITGSFIDGAKELTATALIIAFARGILIISQDGKIIDTILYSLSMPLSRLHPVISAQAMFLVQSFINFFVASGSGQAVLTMPVMAPLADLIGVSRQTAVLAFQFGDGFTNMIIPTSAVTMSVLALAQIPWEKWVKWVFPLQLIFLLIGLLLLIPPFFMNWQ
ncbi:MAG TPA: Na+/H+ antiporter NhaC family protein [Ignavibacteriaceae bacterium]|nr:Na+/H+ antiporter NhaC family protein [Ignavibacteriaceae bacterium]